MSIAPKDPYFTHEFLVFALGVVDKFGDDFEGRCRSGDVAAQNASEMENEFGRLAMEEIAKQWQVKLRVAIAAGAQRYLNSDVGGMIAGFLGGGLPRPRQGMPVAVLSAIIAKRGALGTTDCEELAERWADAKEAAVAVKIMDNMFATEVEYGENKSPLFVIRPSWCGEAAARIVSPSSLLNRLVARLEKAGYKVTLTSRYKKTRMVMRNAGGLERMVLWKVELERS